MWCRVDGLFDSLKISFVYKLRNVWEESGAENERFELIFKDISDKFNSGLTPISSCLDKLEQSLSEYLNFEILNRISINFEVY